MELSDIATQCTQGARLALKMEASATLAAADTWNTWTAMFRSASLVTCGVMLVPIAPCLTGALLATRDIGRYQRVASKFHGENNIASLKLKFIQN